MMKSSSPAVAIFSRFMGRSMAKELMSVKSSGVELRKQLAFTEHPVVADGRTTFQLRQHRR